MNKANVRCGPRAKACRRSSALQRDCATQWGRFAKQSLRELQCCTVDQCPVWGSCTAAPDQPSKVRLGRRKPTPAFSMALVSKGGMRAFAAIANLMGTYSRSRPPTGGYNAFPFCVVAVRFEPSLPLRYALRMFSLRQSEKKSLFVPVR